GDSLGPIRFDAPTAQYFRDQVQAPWFAHFLKDKGPLDLPEALTFEAGSNTWQRWDAWPPKTRAADRHIYMAARRALAFHQPAAAGGAEAHDDYGSDPAHPVPYPPP